jgi:6-phosphofructokinase 1
MAIAIMSSGGDSAGMNPAIKYFVEHSILRKLNPYFIYNGLEGLIDNKIKKASFEDVSGIIHLGGTIIKSSRSKRFFDKKYRKKAYENLKKHKITKIIVLGGDGSFRAMKVFYNEFGIKFIGIPSTIDNDIYGTDYCLGVDTALNMIRSAVDAIRDTASSFKRAFVIETMGRESGYLALVSAITSGAEICVIPEMLDTLDYQKSRIEFEMKNAREYLLAIVAEGSKKRKEMKKWCEDELKLETRVTILGHIQRGGNPTVYDRLMASNFVKKSIDRIVQKECKGEVIVYKDSKFEFKSIDEITSSKYELPQHLIKLYRESYCQKCKG